MPVLAVGHAADLDRAAVEQVAWGRRIRLTTTMLDAVAGRRSEALRALDGDEPVYGVTTGLGAAVDIRLSAAEQATHQHRVLLARAVGGPPWLPSEDARALLAVRLRTLLNGDAGVSPQLCEALARLLNEDVVPAVPATGSGSAGEIIPLAHAFQVLLGEGTVLTPKGTEPAWAALQRAGLTPWRPGAKEGIALLEGVPGTMALALRRAAEARRCADVHLAVAALSAVAIGASQDPYQAFTARGDEVLAGVLERLRTLLDPSGPARMLQAPVSLRVVGPVVAHLERRATQLAEAVDRALDGVTDSPAYCDNGFHGTAGFYGLELATGADALTVAVAHAAEVSAARLHRLLDDRLTGLPRQLAVDPGPEAGLVAVHKRAVGVVHALHRTTLPSSVGTVETSLGQEDVQTFGWEAAEQARTALAGGVEVLACELLAARHAVRLGGRDVPPALRPLVRDVDEVVPEIHGDRSFGVDVEALRAMLASRVSG